METLFKLIQTIKPMLTNIKNISIATVVGILLILLLIKSCENKRLQKRVEQVRIPDTVYIHKIHKVVEIKKEYIEKPIKVYVYLKDTMLRKEAEHSDIITGIDIKHRNLFRSMDILKIDKVTPLGIVLSSEYKLAPLRELKIDMNGNVEIKKKRFTKLKKIGGILLIGAAGFVIGKEFSILSKK
ncbi:MAG: hypothetical protein ACYDCN_17305 [Bacteroidia bacterium]